MGAVDRWTSCTGASTRATEVNHTGEYLNGHGYGFGTCKFACGETYNGEFDYGERVGQGALQSIISAAKNVTDPWELQIVDNGSTDATQSVIEEFKPSLPIYRTEAPVPGLSNARNVGIENARGQFIIWTDDDVIVDGNSKSNINMFRSGCVL